ncbi:MAG: hypothetical protein HKN09_01960 [Saprospiraceae bacterium]|nr:hypothetical protein [Saprospiraceae bacterium]
MNKLLDVRIFILLVFLACQAKENSNPPLKVKQEMNSSNTGELFDYYISNPKSQDELDQNLIIEYAIDNELSLKRTESGLYYIIHTEGEGRIFKHGDHARAHYKGYFLDGREFDSSYRKKRPLRFRVGQMVAGWNEFMKMSNVGTKATIILPSRLAYGSEGFPGFVPANTIVAFDIEIKNL